MPASMAATTQGREAATADDLDSELLHDFRPFIRQYKSGRLVRFDTNIAVAPAGTELPGTGASSKDVVINPTSGLWARLYLPAPTVGRRHHDKLPVVVYFHGGAFVMGSTAHRPTHEYLNRLAADANVLVVSIEYRLAPENPLPTAYDDSWEGLRWVASQSQVPTAGGGGGEPWLAEHGDLSRVFIMGMSAGGNIAHHMAVRAGTHRLTVDVKGLLVVHPLFILAVGRKSRDKEVAAWTEAFWRYICPGAPAGQEEENPLRNPFCGRGAAACVAAERVLVCVAEEDLLRDAGVWYFDSMRASSCFDASQVALFQSAGEDHGFHYTNPECRQARALHERILSFLKGDE